MSRPEHVKCGSCIYFNPYPDGFSGDCRRYPPALEQGSLAATVIEIYRTAAMSAGIPQDTIEDNLEEMYQRHDNDDDRFPTMTAAAWCGEFMAEWT